MRFGSFRVDAFASSRVRPCALVSLQNWAEASTELLSPPDSSRKQAIVPWSQGFYRHIDPWLAKSKRSSSDKRPGRVQTKVPTPAAFLS